MLVNTEGDACPLCKVEIDAQASLRQTFPQVTAATENKVHTDRGKQRPLLQIGELRNQPNEGTHLTRKVGKLYSSCLGFSKQGLVTSGSKRRSLSKTSSSESVSGETWGPAPFTASEEEDFGVLVFNCF